jgi:hypothetical protein
MSGAALRVPGFNDAVAKELTEYAVKEGYTEDQARMMFANPLDVTVIWKAREFDKLQASKPNINNRTQKAPPIVQPGAAGKRQSDTERLQTAFQKTSDRRTKERLGEAILARKLRI